MKLPFSLDAHTPGCRRHIFRYGLVILMACLCEVLHFFWDKPFLHSSANFKLGLSILAIGAAIVFGWILAANTHDIPADAKYLLPWHRWLGIASIFTTIAAFISLHLSRFHQDGWKRGYWLLLASSGILVVVTGHLGGTLVYGVDYFN